MTDDILSAEELAKIEARADAATPGPWKVCPSIEEDFLGVYPDTGKPEFPIAKIPEYIKPDTMKKNAVFIANSRSDIPTLLALITAQAAEIERLTQERDEAVNWSEIVDQHGIDGFDDLAEKWLSMDAILRVHNAVASVFSKWADDGMMARFKAHMSNVMHLSFVEGCIVGVRTAEARAIAAEAKVAEMEKVLEEIRDHAANQDMSHKDFRVTAYHASDAALGAKP